MSKIYVDCKHQLRVRVYSPYIILWRLPFDISNCSDTRLDNSCIDNLLHSKNLKKWHNNFVNRFTNKKKTPENDLDLFFFACIRVIQKSLNINSSNFCDLVQGFEPQIGIFYCLIFKKKQKNKTKKTKKQTNKN